MAESAAEAKPNQMVPLADPPPSSTTPTSSSSSIIADTDTRDGRSGWMGLWNNRGRPSLRVTTEFDSESSVFSHRASFKLLKDGLAKLKLSFLNLPNGHLSDPHLSFVSNLFSLHYDLHDHNALLTTSFPLGPYLRVSASHDLKARQGELSMVANLAHPAYALELSSPLPAVAMPRATLKFPLGEISLQEEEELQEEQVKTPLSLSGFVKSHMLNGLCTAQYSDHDFTLRYSYKDEALSFIPAISLPSNALSFAFKRRFNPCNKLSYWYNFDANTWSAVYKNTYGNDFKFKAGYDSAVRLGWASLWVGDESGKAKTAPMKMKVQFMLQVPQDDIRSSALMFRVKKRWDIW